MDLSKPPAWLGVNYTSKIHSKAQGPTLPENNKVTGPLVVLVTGAGKGLGIHLSLAYARAGATGLIISSRTQADLDKLSAQIRQVNPRCDILSTLCDTTNKSDIEALAAAIKAKYGRLDVCIANAGIISAYLPNGELPLHITDDTDFERVININLTGTALTARHMLPIMIATPSPSVRAFIAITSTASHLPLSAPCTAAYNVSKIAMNRLVEIIAADEADRGVQAFSVHPGAVLTPQTQKHSTHEGDMWEQLLTDDVGLCGGFCTWLTRERRAWASGRYLSSTWDVGELEEKGRSWNPHGDELKMRMVV